MMRNYILLGLITAFLAAGLGFAPHCANAASNAGSEVISRKDALTLKHGLNELALALNRIEAVILETGQPIKNQTEISKTLGNIEKNLAILDKTITNRKIAMAKNGLNEASAPQDDKADQVNNFYSASGKEEKQNMQNLATYAEKSTSSRKLPWIAGVLVIAAVFAFWLANKKIKLNKKTPIYENQLSAQHSEFQNKEQPQTDKESIANSKLGVNSQQPAAEPTIEDSITDSAQNPA